MRLKRQKYWWQKKSFLLTIGLMLNFADITLAQTLRETKEQKVCYQDLDDKIEQITNQTELQKATFGILVQELNSAEIIYQLNSEKYFIPASNLKLFTTAAVLLKLGANFQIKTPIYLQGESPNIDKLMIVGKGDPTINDEHLESLALQLKQNGVYQINKLTVKDGYLLAQVINDSWEFSDIYYYYAVPVNSLILNENTVTLTLIPSIIEEPVNIKWSDKIAAKQWRIDNQTITAIEGTKYNININPIFATSTLILNGELAIDAKPDDWWLAIPQPEEYFLDSLRQVLARYGIIVNSTEIIYDNKTEENNLSGELFFEFESPELAELIKITNQDSNNLFAEVLLKYLGVNNTELSQFESLEEILTKLGIEQNSYQLKDGSGLSRHNLITPSALVQLLQLIANTEYYDIFLDSLAVAGKNGTLQNRFKDTIVTDKLYGKTGTLSGVSALSGYLQRENEVTLVISIIVNNSTLKSSSLRKIIDEIVLLFAQAKDCSSNYELRTMNSEL